jgi:hypothetical protein
VKPLALVLPLLLLTACGASTKAAESSGLTKAGYLAQAEAVCATANTEKSALKVPTADVDFTPYVTGVVRVADKAAAALARITPPKADAAALAQHVTEPLATDLAAGHAYITATTTGPAAGRDKALSDLLAVVGKTKPDTDWMRSYGFVQCVKAISLTPS